jgi:PleD family two-component response regulator
MGKYVIAAVDDMFFASKIRATAEHLGLDVRFAKSVETVMETAHAELPSLIIADLHSGKCNPFNLAEQLKADEQLRAVPLVGFFSHVQTALRERAEASGFDRIMPRSAFSKYLPEILECKIKN